MADSAVKKTPAARKTPTKKAPARAGTAQQSSGGEPPAKKSSARKATAKKSSASRTSTKRTNQATASRATPPREPHEESSDAKAPRKARARTEARQGTGGRESSQPTPHRPARGGARVAGAAREAVRDLAGKEPEAVTGIHRGEDGWSIEVEVLELERIPNTTDVLATYRVELDDDGEVRGYRRLQRYLRGSAGGEGA